MDISEIIATYDIGPLKNDSEEISFRIEIHKSLNKKKAKFAKVWRFETYRIQPTFPLRGNRPLHHASDEIIMVEELEFGVELGFRLLSISSILRQILDKISARFGNEATIAEGMPLRTTAKVPKKR